MTEAIFNSFSQSVDRLAEILKEPKNVANRDSAIKRFELTFELAWKLLKKYLAGKNIVCRSPRDCFEKAFREGIIPDNPLWVQMIEDRNLSIHTYNEKLADEIYNRLNDYAPLFVELRDKINERQ
jgi:nucleotidyltransferase substrate binding protein (TIGR01987 family)